MFHIIPQTFWYDFVAKRRFWAFISFAMSAVGLALFLAIGPNWSIDFTGGTEVEMHFPKETSISEVRTGLSGLGIADDAIQRIGEESESRYLVRIQGEAKADPGQIEAVKSALATAFGPTWVSDFVIDTEVGSRAKVTYTGDVVPLERIQEALKSVPGSKVQGSPDENSFYVRLPGIAEGIRSALSTKFPDKPPVIERTDSVGPKVGGNLRTAGIMAILVSTLLHLVYIGVRFDFAFAPGAIICILHDVCITIGVLVLTRQEFGLSTVSALLTLTGYSLNDTIVVYDRIRENMHRHGRKNFGELINESINQTLSRTVMTSGATALAMLPFLFMGGTILQEFATVMLVGIVVGTYSSIYVAAPLTMILRDNQDTILRVFGLGKKSPPAGPPAKGGTAVKPS